MYVVAFVMIVPALALEELMKVAAAPRRPGGPAVADAAAGAGGGRAQIPDRRDYARAQKRAKLMFNTKLGMHSPV